ncbi:hypothetical protein TRAPUB_9680 [Trametes pubescens]|uniref:Uncharacterized protein n=1 Tax=Trametes pubescens TaxID=154538 RepID=A0A1M2W1X5_TRAPU|nr:hypothetical protein TRAPUB_9680 [Trametes pubescens]
MTIPEDISLTYLLSNNAKWANGIKEEDAEFFRKRSTDSEEPETEVVKPKVRARSYYARALGKF